MAGDFYPNPGWFCQGIAFPGTYTVSPPPNSPPPKKVVFVEIPGYPSAEEVERYRVKLNERLEGTDTVAVVLCHGAKASPVEPKYGIEETMGEYHYKIWGETKDEVMAMKAEMMPVENTSARPCDENESKEAESLVAPPESVGEMLAAGKTIDEIRASRGLPPLKSAEDSGLKLFDAAIAEKLFHVENSLPSPNPDQTWGELRRDLRVDLGDYGRALAWLVPNQQGVTVEVYRLPVERVVPMPYSASFPKGAWRIDADPSLPNAVRRIGAVIPAGEVVQIKMKREPDRMRELVNNPPVTIAELEKRIVDKYENGKVPKNIVMPRAGGKTENAGLTYDQKWAWEPRPGDKEEIAAAHADGGLPVPPELVPAIEKMQNDGVIACGASIVVGPAPSVYSGESGREAIIARVAADRRDEAAVILNRELKLRGLRPDGKLVAPESIRFVPDGIAYSFKG